MHCGRCGEKPAAWGTLLASFSAHRHRKSPLSVCTATCVDQSPVFLHDFVRRNYAWKWPKYSCSQGKRDGHCGAVSGKRFCPVTCGVCGVLLLVSCAVCGCTLCCSAEKPHDESAFLLSEHFCVSKRQSCGATSVCGRYIVSVKNCKEAVMQLPLVRKMSSRAVFVVNQSGAPKGCLLDHKLGAHFNTRGTSQSNYAGLLSVCCQERWLQTHLLQLI